MMGLIYFIIILGIIVIVHEFGHFIIGKVSGVTVEEFAIGMGPKLIGFNKNGTDYSLRLFPIGGYCKFKDEDGLQSENGEITDGSFNSVSVWKRISIVTAGPIFNMVLTYVLCIIICSGSGAVLPVVNEIMDGYPAQEAGFQTGDKIIKINGKRIYTTSDMNLVTMLSPGEPIEIVYERNGEQFSVEVTPKKDENGSYLIGFGNFGQYEDSKGLRVFKHAYYNTRYYFNIVFESLGMLFGGQVTLDDMAGPVGMAQMVSDIESEARQTYDIKTVIMVMVSLTAMLSVNIGIMNLLPIPALDGGRLVFLLIEAVRGKPIPVKYEAAIDGVFMLLLFGFMIVVSFNDVLRIFNI